MRARLVELVPEAEALEGAAERIPLADASVDAITVGQAFHWFRLDEALPELHRVLRPGGLLAVMWNMRAPGPVQDALFEILRPLHGATPAHADSAWREQVESSELFGASETQEFRWAEEVDPELVVRRVLSISFVAALPRERQDEVAAQVREALPGLPRPLRYPLRTEVFISVRHTGTE
jgi:SAM-dependent methyltransferase